MAYKNKSDQNKTSKSHYQKHKKYYLKKAKEWNKKYSKRNLKYIRKVKMIYGCQHCGYKKVHEALEFHHLDRSQKDFSIANMARASYSIKRIKKELRKCVLLCCRCHREEHVRLKLDIEV